MRKDPPASRSCLPHVPQDGGTYFLTWRVAPEQPDLAPRERTLVADALRRFHRRRYDLVAWVVMNDHVHVLACLYEGETTSKVLHSWKSYTTRAMQKETRRSGAVWQQGYFDRVVRSERELEETADYIAGNPFRRWPAMEGYPWVAVPANDTSEGP